MPRNPQYDSFQRTLIDARQANCLTQQEVALRLDKPQSFVSKYETGERRLDVIEFLEVCKAIGINPLSILKKLGINND